MGKVGRPPSYKPELAEETLRRIAAGETLTRICSDAHMPVRSTIHEWNCGRGGAPESFSSDYVQARREQGEVYFEQVLSISDDTEGADMAAIASAKLRADSRKWVLARMDSGRYGDRTSVDIGGQSDAKPVQVEHVVEINDLLETLEIVREVCIARDE